MRASAEIEPVALLVDLQVLAWRNGVHQLDLEHLALVAEILFRLVAAPEFLGEGRVALDDLMHLRFDLGEIVGVERLLLGEVVVETVLDDRADGHLSAGPQGLHGLRHDVRSVMSDQLERLGVGPDNDLDVGIGLDGVGQIRQFAVKRDSNRLLGQRLGDAGRQLGAGQALLEGPFATIRESQRNIAHGHLLSLAAYQAGKVGASGPIAAPAAPCARAGLGVSSRPNTAERRIIPCAICVSPHIGSSRVGPRPRNSDTGCWLCDSFVGVRSVLVPWGAGAAYPTAAIAGGCEGRERAVDPKHCRNIAGGSRIVRY